MSAKSLFADIFNNSSESEEVLFHNASDALFQEFSSPEKTNREKLVGILELALAYFRLDTAVVSSITGDSFLVYEAISNVEFPLVEGDTLKLCDTPANNHFGKTSFYSFVQKESKDASYIIGSKTFSVLSYISSAVETVNGPFGSVCFSSQSTRPEDFTPLDERILVQVSGWLGCLLGANEQLEFASTQNEHYKTLFASVPAMMFLCDADGLIISSSDQFAREVGLSTDDVPGKMCNNFFHADDKNTVRQTISEGQGVCVPAKLLRKEQADLEVELSVCVKPIGTMQNIRMVIAADVSDRNAAFRAITDKNRLLETANESLNQFAYVASHDLQEPLRKIQLFSNFLEEDLGDALVGENKDHLDIIVNASQRMSALIEDLLHYSRASSVDPDMSTVDLTQLVNSVLSDLELLIKDNKASVTVSDLPTVTGNEPLLRQMFTNLVGNAIKYQNPGQSAVVQIFCNEENGQQQLVVADNGIGFDNQYAEKIFEPFKRLHTNEHFKGTGIGLAICATVCEKHGWTINASCKNEEGSTFTIGLCNE